MKTFMEFLLGYVEMELGTYYSKWLKRQNRPYRPVLYLSAPAYYGQEREEGSTVLCHKREKMTTVGERVVRLILYQTKGW